MIQFLIFSLIVFLIQAENCTFIPVTHIPATEGIYFERPDERKDTFYLESNYTLNGFVWGNGNIDYNNGSSLFYSEFLKISDEEFNDTIQAFNCTQYDNYEDVAATGKVDINLTAEDYQEYLDKKSWLCTIPQGFAAAGVKTILQVSQNQITKLDGYCLLFTVIDDVGEEQYKSLMSGIKKKILKAVKKYDLSSNIYYTNLPRTEASIYEELGNRVAQNNETFTLEELPNKLPLNMRMFTTFYPPGANILIGRVNLGNPNLVLIFSAQPMTECKKTGHLKQRNREN